MRGSLEKKILICGGGTAGHIYPAVAIIEHIRKNYPATKLVYVGTERGMEKEFISRLGVDFRKIKATGLASGGNFFKRVLVLLKFLFFVTFGFLQSTRIVLESKPDLVLGMGGYVCVPVLLACIVLGKKFVLHEQNYIPGRVNRIFSRFARKIFVSFDETKRFLKVSENRVIFSGNPVRESIKKFSLIEPDYEKWGLEKQRFTVVAFGGSLGAEKINNVTIGLYHFYRDCSHIQFLLICGERFYKDLEKRVGSIRDNKDRLVFRIFPYVHEMEEIYRIADLIISRAGANTIAELSFCNIPAILIPYPWAIENHQYHNANFLARNGKGILILDSELSEKVLVNTIESLLADDRRKYKKMKEKIMGFQNIRSAEIITNSLMEI
ncbi:MAG: undecaprenyldiphospho-muramoylpentapeptide beta-N-acetylglucosaminyltransferase [Actinobacteria bacterium]|nr:undecaprenyldiphospho-muramoylpentapeptide beta-N-acetylglucosaminyltransferase [Actinomycetota bacterium]